MADKPTKFLVKGAMRHVILGALVLAALLGGYAWRGRTPPAQPADPPEPMTIAANTRYVGTSLVFVAHVKGYFANEGLNVTVQPYTTGKSALDATLERRADLATVADIPIMFAVTKGQPVSIVATIAMVERDPGIIGRKDKGVLTLANLNGKRIGVTLGTSGHFVLDAFLICAERFCQNEPEAARQIIAGAINVSLENLQEVWPTYRFNVALHQSLLLTLEDETRWAIKNQLTANSDIPNYLNYLYLDGLRAVKPESVTVIH
jgi:ABC-type nitrate/sulfonate/bicarbonate transport system substrate-binding protein